MTPNRTSAQRGARLLRSPCQHNHGLHPTTTNAAPAFPIMTSAAPAFSDHGQRGASFFRSRLARRRFFPITPGAAPVFSDPTGAAPLFSDYSRLPTACGLPITRTGRRFFSDHDQRGTRFFRSRPARSGAARVFPITTSAALGFSDRDLRGADFFQSRVG